MTDLITHKKVSTKSDGVDTTLVLPSDWNDGHVDPAGNKIGFAPIFVAASNATAKEKSWALLTNGVVCTGTSDLAAINTLMATFKHIKLSSGTFTDATVGLLPPNITTANDAPNGAWLEGNGNDTIINYTKNTGYLYGLIGSASTAAVSTGNRIEKMRFSAPNTTDGLIQLKGTYFNTFSHLSFNVPNGKVCEQEYSGAGSGNYQNFFKGCSIDSAGGANVGCQYGFYTTAASGGTYIEDCDLVFCAHDLFYNTGASQYFRVYHSQLKSTVNSFNVSGGYWRIHDVYNDGGAVLISGSTIFEESDCDIAAVTCTAPAIHKIVGDSSGCQGYYHGGTIYDGFPLRRSYEAQDYGDSSGVTNVSDAAASNGKAIQFSAQYSYAYYKFYYYQRFGGYLPRGQYLFTFYAKDTAQVANDLLVQPYDVDITTSLVDGAVAYHTLTSTFIPHSVLFTVNSTNAGHAIRIQFMKMAANANTITLGHGELIYLGSEFETKVVLPAGHYLQFSNVDALPTASIMYRNQMAVVDGGAGATDTLYMCLKSAANTYSWVSVKTGG